MPYIWEHGHTEIINVSFKRLVTASFSHCFHHLNVYIWGVTGNHVTS